MNSLPKTVTRQRRGCDLNPGPSAPESSTLTSRLASHPFGRLSWLKANSHRHARHHTDRTVLSFGGVNWAFERT